MGFFKFYWLVFREAFRHSLDIAQAVIFVCLTLGGLIVAQNPASKPMIDALNLGGWQIAAIVSGTIIGVRLLLAPYWLWRRATAQVILTPERSVDHRLRFFGFGNQNNKQKRAIQIFFILSNSSYFHLIRYEVEEVYVEIDGKTADENVAFVNRGETVEPNTKYNFYYHWIFLNSKQWIKPGTTGHASISYKYGIAGQPFTRRARYAATFVIEKTGIKHHLTEESDEPIV